MPRTQSIWKALSSPRIVRILLIRYWSRIWDPAPHNSTTFWWLLWPFLLIWHTQIHVLLIRQPIFTTLAAVELRGVPLFQHLRDPCPHNSTAFCDYCDWPFNPTHLDQAGFRRIKRTENQSVPFTTLSRLLQHAIRHPFVTIATDLLIRHMWHRQAFVELRGQKTIYDYCNMHSMHSP